MEAKRRKNHHFNWSRRFSTKEINLATENHFIPVTLGNTRLRTETAALVACHTIALINE